MVRRNGILISNLTDCGRKCIRFDGSLYPLVITTVKDTGNDSDSNPNTDTPRTGWTGFRFLFFQIHLFFFPLATSRGNPGGFWHDPGRDFLRTAPNS